MSTRSSGAAAQAPSAQRSKRPPDRRVERGQRTRSRVLEAVLALQEEGHLAPTSRMVADRAGVGLRTVFMHFADMETLGAEAARRQLRRLAGMVERVDPAAPLEVRIRVFCRSRVRVLEKLLPVMRAARLRDPDSPQLATSRQLLIAAADAAVAQAFAPELGVLDAKTRAQRLDALYLASGGPAWEALRIDRGLAPRAAAKALQDAVTQALAPRADDPAPAMAALVEKP